jgi:hypothetical protein
VETGLVAIGLSGICIILITNFRRVAVAPVLFPFTGLHLLEFKAHDWGALLVFLDRSFEIGTFPVSLLSQVGCFRPIAASDLLSLTTPAEVHHSSMNPVELRPPAIHHRTLG